MSYRSCPFRAAGRDPDVEGSGGRADLLPRRAADALGDEKGIIKPLGTEAMPLIAWRLRNVGETRSRLLLTGMPTCANCHSFSLDGKTLGMDLDGPQNDKGLYALIAVKPQMSIRTKDVIEWRIVPRPSGEQDPGRLHVAGFAGRPICGDHRSTARGPVRERSSRRATSTTPISRTIDSCRCSIPPAASWPGTAATTGKLQPLPGADDPALRADGCRLEPGRQIPGVRPGRGAGPIPDGQRSPSTPTIRTKRRSSTISTESRSTTARAESRSASRAPRKTG